MEIPRCLFLPGRDIGDQPFKLALGKRAPCKRAPLLRLIIMRPRPVNCVYVDQAVIMARNDRKFEVGCLPRKLPLHNGGLDRADAAQFLLLLNLPCPHILPVQQRDNRYAQNDDQSERNGQVRRKHTGK